MNTPKLRVGFYAKLMAAFLLVVLVTGLSVTWLVDQATRREFQLFTTAVSQRQAERIAPLLAAYYEINGSWDGVEETLSFRSSEHGAGMRPGMPMFGGNPQDMWKAMGTEVFIVDPTGTIIAASDQELVGADADKTSLTQGVAIHLNGELVGTVLVTVGAFSGPQNDVFLGQVSRATLLAALIAGLVALVLGGFITWGVTRPVRQLTQAADAIAAGDLSQRVDVKSSDEVGDLANAFNQMASELEQAETLRRQMTADIAHELRTPLSVIQGNVEALQDGVFPLTTEALEPIRDKTKLLGRLVEDLRELALAEAGRMPLDRQPTDLRTLAEKVVTGFQPSAEAKAIELAIEARPDLPEADVDSQRIEQVLMNLLTNALRHTPENGRITIAISNQDAHSFTLRVTDSGSGIPAEALPHVFERFYRVDKGRARGADGEGSGLGLAVARSIIEAHGGQIGVDSPSGQGASFWFTIPSSS